MGTGAALAFGDGDGEADGVAVGDGAGAGSADGAAAISASARSSANTFAAMPGRSPAPEACLLARLRRRVLVNLDVERDRDVRTS